MSAHMPYMGPSAKVGGALGRASAAQGPGRDAGEERQALEAAAKEFESLLVNEMLKAMRKTVPKDGLTEQGFGEKIFTEMHDERLAQSMSKMGGLGLHRMLVDQLGGELAAGPRPGEMIHPLGAGDHRVSSDFGPRTHPIHGDRRMHGGVDLPAKAGADVLAAQGGEVVRSADCTDDCVGTLSGWIRPHDRVEAPGRHDDALCAPFALGRSGRRHGSARRAHRRRRSDRVGDGAPLALRSARERSAHGSKPLPGSREAAVTFDKKNLKSQVQWSMFGVNEGSTPRRYGPGHLEVSHGGNPRTRRAERARRCQAHLVSGRPEGCRSWRSWRRQRCEGHQGAGHGQFVFRRQAHGRADGVERGNPRGGCRPGGRVEGTREQRQVRAELGSRCQRADRRGDSPLHEVAAQSGSQPSRQNSQGGE